MRGMKELAEIVGRKIKEHVENELKPVLDLIHELDERIAHVVRTPGPKGDKGDPGESIKGDKGAPGKDGESVDIVMLKSTVAGWVQDAVKLMGFKDGKDGLDGRDALEIVPLDGIDPAKSYKRGTWASFRGGLLRSFRDTEPLGELTLEQAGWKVIVEGIAQHDVAGVDGDARSVVVRSVLTSGKTVESRFDLPAMRYRGIYRDGGDYALHDTVTWAGSLWYRSSDGTGQPGHEGSGWTLCVKRGQNGKDGGSR